MNKLAISFDAGNFIKNLTKNPMKNPWGEPWEKGKPLKESQKKRDSKPDKISGDFSKKIGEFLKKISDQDNNNGKYNWKEKFYKKDPRSIIVIIFASFVLAWLSFGIYKVDSDENAAVIYFGKFYSVTTPGLNYYFPYPFGKIIKKSVAKINTEEFGFS